MFTDDGIIEVPFDGDGHTTPVSGRPALEAMTAALRGVLRFDQVTVTRVIEAGEDVIVVEYSVLLHRSDLDSSFRRRYISVMTLRQGRLAHVREYGGPFMPPTTPV